MISPVFFTLNPLKLPLLANNPSLLCGPPLLPPLKVNWNTTCDKKLGKIGIGMIVRDSEGKVYCTLQKYKPFLDNPFTAKILGLWHAVCF